MEKFELKPWNRGISNEDLVTDLRRVSSLLGKPSVTYDEYDEHGKCRSRTVEVRFGGWNKALRAAGLEVTRRNLSDEELFENLRDVWTRLGRQPTRDDLRDKSNSGSKFGRNTYGNRFGTWRKALEAFVLWANREDDATDNSDAKPTRAKRARVRAPSDRLRFRVMLRDNFKCQYCGKSPATHAGLTLHLDHLVPFSRGGESDFQNLITACSKCNLGKGDLSADAPAH